MVFSSIMFVFVFLPIVLLAYLTLYFIVDRVSKKSITAMHLLNSLLLFFSLVFYAWGEPKNILILLFCTLGNYIIALLISRFNHSKIMLALGVSLNLGLLLYYKYAMLIFTGDTLSAINSITPESWFINDILNIALPLGISFYIFQAISYLIDVYRDEVAPAKNIIDFACYLTMFPQLVAGPIVRYSQVVKELRYRSIDTSCFSNGITRFI